VVAWHGRPGALERLVPPWEAVQVLDRSGDFETACVVLRVPIGPLRLIWVAQHRLGEQPLEWIDTQVRGPFARWSHWHRLAPLGSEHSRLTDRVEYALPLWPLAILADPLVRHRLERAFAYRHRVTRDDLESHARWADRPRLTVAVTGATGLIGRALVAFLTSGGHRVIRLVRGSAPPGDLRWDPLRGVVEHPERLEGVDAVVHLAGESIAHRWTVARKQRIWESREGSTRLLATTLARLERPPAVLVSSSAIGIYGDRGEEPLTETSPTPEAGPRRSFLTRVAQAWEAAVEPAEQAGIRVVRLRFGVVLSPAGGALALQLPAFRIGLGGALGTGRQYLSWIAIDDAVGAIYQAINDPSLEGPVNAVAPQPVTNAEYARALGRVLGRPTPSTTPAAALRAALGEMADDTLLSGAKVLPVVLQESGYPFRFPDLEGALRYLLGRPAVPFRLSAPSAHL
jgi:uncharacterized protein (TIGR01777 family)